MGCVSAINYFARADLERVDPKSLLTRQPHSSLHIYIRTMSWKTGLTLHPHFTLDL